MIKRTYILTLISALIMSCNSQNPSEILASKEWEVVSIEESSDFSKNPTITFNTTENKVNGNAGCNNFFGELTVEGNNITIGKVGATKMLCPDMTAEDRFLKVIDRVASFRFDDDTLVLLSKDSNELMVLK